MSDDRFPSNRAVKRTPATRRLTLRSRVRRRGRQWVERALGAETLWSFAFVALALVLIGSEQCGTSYPELRVGEISARDIVTKFDLQVIDPVQTDAKRQQTREAILEVWEHDSLRGSRLAEALSQVFRTGRQTLGEEEEEELTSVEAYAHRALKRQRYSESLEREMTAMLRDTMSNWIVGSRRPLFTRDAISLLHRPDGVEETVDSARYFSLRELREVRNGLQRRAQSDLPVPTEDRKFLAQYLADWVDVNVISSESETVRRRNAAAKAVDEVLKRVERGTLLIREGDRVDEEMFNELSAVRVASQGQMGFEELFSLLFLLSLLAFFLHRYATYHQRQFHKLDHLHALMAGLILVVLLLTKSLLWLAGLILPALSFPFDRIEAYIFLSPLAAAPIIVALLANGRIAMVFSAFSAVVFGAMCGLDYSLFIWALLVQWAAIYGISSYRDRAAVLRAGFIVGAMGAFLALVLTVVDGTLRPWPLSLAKSGFAFVGGAVGVGLVVSFALPLLEKLFGVLTDVRLLELSNSEHFLLKELAIKAPGTYNHSLVVGTLSEEAARAVNANALFCRVAASYHDIGKMLKPEYYVENQRGVNPHDKLSPSMSALIIAAHVKDGIKLAREAGLPEQIVDIIPQHHGTRSMSYFYEKAKQRSDPAMEQVKEAEFRYPGPKPQSREAAIMMMADGVEAAAKSLDEPTPNRLAEVIRKITDAIVMEGQLEECDLTFTDFKIVQAAFLRSLLSMYHQRVDYPGYDFDAETATT